MIVIAVIVVAITVITITVAIIVITVTVVMVMMFVFVRNVGIFQFAGRNGRFDEDGTAVDGDDVEVGELCGNEQGLAGCKQIRIHSGGAVLRELEGNFAAQAGVNDEGAELLCVNVQGIGEVNLRYGKFVALFKGAGYFILI